MTLLRYGKSTAAIVLSVLAAVPLPAAAEPTGNQVRLTEVRPYNASSGGAAWVQVDQTSVCSTTVYKIDFTIPGGKEVYAAALTALATGKTVKVEVLNSTGCQGWGTTIQSLYVLN